ncbi:MAG: hypothetical protein E4G94_08530 [ANME-2 cluster archaeon]|nr:MAG: hypothetical protein E4G94_08530 [ANME-2 cluster archaeon]
MWAYNNSGSGSLSVIPASQNKQVMNNIPVQSTIGNKAVVAGNVLTFIVSASDADSDTITYGTNATKGTLNPITGIYSFAATTNNIGTYIWSFNSKDNYGGIANETIILSVTNGQGICIDLNNNSGELTVNDSTTLNNISNATWSIWLNQKQLTSNAGIFGKYQALTGKRSYIIRTSSTNEISIVLSGNGNSTTSYDTNNTRDCGLRNNDEWTMISVTYNGSYSSSSALIRYYRNGVYCDADLTDIKSLYNAPLPLSIGGSNSIFFNGSIDETFMYNQSFPEHQVYRLNQESEHGLAGVQTIPVILYHQVVKNGTADAKENISIDIFQQQIAYLYDNNFTTITAENINQWQKGNFTMPNRPVILYFDDGWDTVYTNAMPTLDQYGYIGVVAAITDYTDKVSNGEWSGYMTWPQLQTLQNKGWEIASHSINHYVMLTLSETEFRRNLNETSNSIKANLGRKPTSFVFPYHNTNATYTAICGEYYDLCWTYGSSDQFPYYTDYSDNGHVYQSLKRITIFNTTTLETFKNMFIKETYTCIGAWPLNEGAGNIAYDYSGNGNNAILNANATWYITQQKDKVRLPVKQPPKEPPLPPSETLA